MWGKGIIMNKNLLWELCNDFIKEGGYYKIYIFVAIIAFLITFESIKPVVQIFRIIYAIVPLVFLVPGYIKFKDIREKEENARMRRAILFFTLLTLAAIVSFIRD